jgi:hypothetical protein
VGLIETSFEPLHEIKSESRVPIHRWLRQKDNVKTGAMGQIQFPLRLKHETLVMNKAFKLTLPKVNLNALISSKSEHGILSAYRRLF